MKPIRKMRLFAAALAVACLLAATVRTVAAGRGKAVLTGVVYGDGAPLAGVCVSDGVQFLQEKLSLSFPDAYRLLSAVCDIQISQVVNDWKTARLHCPKFDTKIETL